MNAPLTLGSLFDGIGGFPLAGVRHSIIPVWASEIESFPIAVTRLRFPRMLHVGDITKLKGAELPPVDIVTGGSPCQDLSIAGQRAGLAGERSGLFMEQIRIVKEMRDEDMRNGRADDSVRPRYMVWENVPGAFSSANGEDFRAVLEETCGIADGSVSIPRPPGGIWLSAGAIMGEEFSVAWRLLDAQYWGLAQRRKRIFLVTDFGGRTAPKILFEQDGLPRDTAPGAQARQGTAAVTPAGAGDTGGSAACHGETGSGQAGQGNPCVLTAGFSAGQSVKAGGIGYQEECALTLKASESGTNMVPSVLCLNDQGGNRMDVSMEVTGTLRARMDGHPPLVLGCQEDSGKNNRPVLFENHGIDSGYSGPHAVAPAMSAHCGTSGNNVPLVSQSSMFLPDSDEESGPGVSYCIAGNIIDRQDHNGGNGIGVQRDISYTLNTADRHCVFSQQRSNEYLQNEVVCTQSARQYKDATDLVCGPEIAGVDCRSATENGDLCGTLQSHPSGGYSLNTLHPVRIGRLVRRLTPLECERLMGFPDHWTDMEKASDSARYKALGNSAAIPCVEFVLRGIAYFLRKSREEGND